MSLSCCHCQKSLDLEFGQKINRTEVCQHCGFDLKCCKMCEHFDTSAYNDCKEPMADRIVEKEKANFCDYFNLGSTSDSLDNKKNALDLANSLFKD